MTTAGTATVGGPQGPGASPSKDPAAGSAVPRPDEAQDAQLQQEYHNLALFEDADQYKQEKESTSTRPWYKRWQLWGPCVALGVTSVLVVLGVCFQLVPAWRDAADQAQAQVYRWLYFFALWPVLGVVVGWANSLVFETVEWVFYRDAVSHLRSVRTWSRALLFMLLILPWWTVIFTVAWCNGGGCQVGRDAADVLWRILLCMMFFTLANFLKAFVAKLLSAQFYHSAHMKKVKQAIQKEYYLRMLSQERTTQQQDSWGVSIPPLDSLVLGGTLGMARSGFIPFFTSQSKPADTQRSQDQQQQVHRCSSENVHAASVIELQRKAQLGTGGSNSFPGALNTPRGAGLSSGPCTPVPSATSTAAPSAPAVGVQDTEAGTAAGQSLDKGAAAGGIRDPITQLPSRRLEQTFSLTSTGTQQTARSMGRPVTAASGVRFEERRSVAVDDDPLLEPPEVLEAVKVGGKKVDVSAVPPAEWDRLRQGIAQKTFTALMARYRHMSEAEEQFQLQQANQFAVGLFFHVKEDTDREFLIRSDFDPFFPNNAIADQAFYYFDKDGDLKISLEEMQSSVLDIFRERKNMADSLRDTDSIVNSLELALGAVFNFLCIAVYLIIWNFDVMKGFGTFQSTVLALAFIFGNSVKNMFESMLFLFVEHAFDVGDLLEVEGVQYRVKKMQLLCTLLVKLSGEHIYYPNPRLIGLPMANLTRSTGKSDKVVLALDVGKSSEAVLEALKAAVAEHHANNTFEFVKCPDVTFSGLVDPCKVQLSVSWDYSFGPDNLKRAASVKTGLLTKLHTTLATLPLEFSLTRGTREGTGSGATGDGSNPDSAVAQQAAAARGFSAGRTDAATAAAVGLLAAPLIIN